MGVGGGKGINSREGRKMGVGKAKRVERVER